jgi:ABC-type dipeptide/oligopeptide/nickel transport system permease component
MFIQAPLDRKYAIWATLMVTLWKRGLHWNIIHIFLLFMLSLPELFLFGIYTEFTDGHNLGILPVDKRISPTVFHEERMANIQKNVDPNTLS